MLLKTSNNDKAYVQTNGKGKSRSLNSRIHRKTLKIASKPSGKGKRVPAAGKRISLGKNQKNFHVNFPPTTSSSLCDNSNDSGLGFDHHESHHIHPHCNMSQQQQVLTLVNNNYLHRTTNSTIRYGNSEVISSTTHSNIAASASSSSSSTTTTHKHGSLYMGAGKKIKGIKKFPITTNLTLKTETEDTCGDDFFSTHVQKKNNESQLSSTIKSPSASDSSEKQGSIGSSSSSSVTSLSERSSPSTPTDEISSTRTEPPLENFDGFSSLQNQQLLSVSRDGSYQLQILTQPEQQHRARYQTEGSRGAVKDKSGNGFPVVKLKGFNKPTTLQVFIGNDFGRVTPHIFYQACKVSGKNSTPCNEIKIDGTTIIEIEMNDKNDMTVVCDCVGILKERNVDVEHRLGKSNSLAASVTRNKKKSTKCRMIFRAKIDDNETLQVCSNTITCTQPPGVPEISKKSLDSTSARGGQELFIIGKNFLKDTKVTFVRFEQHLNQPSKKVWEESVVPDKEYLQQTHLICVIPPYQHAEELTEPIQVQIYVTSSNKKSEPHNFIYLPTTKPPFPSTVDISGNITFANSTSTVDIMPPPLPPLVHKSSFASPEACSTNETTTTTLKCEYIDQTLNSNNVNGGGSGEQTQSTSSSSPTNLQPTNPNLFGDSAMIDVTNPCFVSQVQVQNLLNEAAALDLQQHIKTEQNDQQPQQQSLMASPQNTNVIPQITQDALVQQQQQQVVENFINMICAQVEVPPSIVSVGNGVSNNDINHHHLNNELMMNTNTSSAPSTLPDHTTNLISAISSQTPMICETNLIPISMNRLDPTSVVIGDCNTSNDTSNASLVSNAVSESVAETQAVVQNIIANVAAEILQQENPTETQSTINNFISTTLSASIEQQQQQISSSQQQQLQDIITQELLAPVLIKKEEDNGQQQIAQETLMNVVAPTNVSASTNAITQPFSPTPDFNLTMSESDLINFINPTVFM